ncbi:MAG: hypothetical protein H7835_09270 [Magnetococcus sp. XQGC-1]
MASLHKGSERNNLESSDSSKKNDAFGAAIGTLVVTFAQGQPDNYAWKNELVAIAPTLAVVISWAFAWIEGLRKDRLSDRIYEKNKKELQGIIQSPETPDNIKIVYMKKLEELRAIRFSADFDLIRSLSKNS